MNRPDKQNQQRLAIKPSQKSLWPLAMASVFLGSSIAQIPRVNAQSVVPGVVIENQATGSFVNPSNNEQVNIESNIVQVTIAELAGITLTPAGVQEAAVGVTDAGPSQGNGNFEAEDIVYFLFTATNVGNDPTQFFIPGAPSNISNGTQAGQIEIIGLDSDGPSGSSTPQDFSNIPITIRPEGNNTGDATAMGIPVGAIPANGTITLRVPIKIDAGLSSGDVSVTLGNTNLNDNSAATQNKDYTSNNNLDVYTQDNEDSDGITGEGVGKPINGDSTFNRKEASASNSLTIGGTPTETHTLSGYVFVDEDGDNARGNDEAILSNVNVRLFEDTNNDGQLTDVDDSDGDGDIDIDDAIAITSTDTNGFYQFERLDDNYLVVVDQGDYDLTGFTYGGVAGSPNNALNEERNADLSGADITTGLDFPFDIVLPGPPIIDLDSDDSSGVTGSDFANTFTAGGPAVRVADSDVEITDNEATIQSATIILTNRPDGDANELLSITDGSGVTASVYDANTGTITLTGSASLSVYQSIISTLTYDNTTAVPSTTDRIVTVQVTDSDGFSSNIAQSTISIRELTNIVPNPDLERGCDAELRLILVLDSSGSVEGSEITNTRTGVIEFLNEINTLSPGNVEVAIVEFATRAALGLDYTTVNTTNIASVFTDYMNNDYYNDGVGTNVGGSTNWEAPLQVALEELEAPDALLFTTDGDPNTLTNDDGSTSSSGTVQAGIDAAIPYANQIKFQGTHIFAIGITDDPNDVKVPTNFYDIADGDTNTEEFNGTNALTADYLDIDDYIVLGTALGDFVDGLLSSCSTTSPNVLLVKRITGVNGSSNNLGVDLASYDPDSTYPYDDNTVESGLDPEDTDKWPDPTTFLIGARDGGVTEPGDEIEYTIYFLSAGTEDAQNVEFCDRLPDGQTFVADTFNNDSSTTQDIDGIIGEDLGIMVSYNGNSTSYTNIGGDDVARFYPPGSGLPPSCNILLTQSEHNGAVVVNLGNIPKADSAGSPATSYGFVRFRATVE